MITSKGFKRYFANISWLFAGKVFNMAVAFLIGIFVIRYLGPKNYGLFSYAKSFVGLFSFFVTLGLGGIVVRNMVKDHQNTYQLLGTAFILKLCGALCGFGIVSIVILFTSNDSFINLIMFIIAFAMIFGSLNVIDFYFTANVLSKFVIWVNTVILIISSCIKLYFIYIKAPLLYFVLLVLGDSLMFAIGLIVVFSSQKMSIARWKFDKKLSLELLKDSWPLLLTSVVATLHLKIDQVMIKEMMDTASVGNYAAAVKLSEAWYFVPSIILGSLFPAIVNAKKVNETLYYNRLQKLYDLMTILAISVAIAVTFLAHPIINLIYGNAYSQAGTVLIIHIWSAVSIFVAIVMVKWFLVENLQKYTLFMHLIGVLLNISLNLILIPVYGINGAAFTTLISYFGITVITPLLFPKIRKGLFMVFISYLHIFTHTHKYIKSIKYFILHNQHKF